jgi:hypothetical protein
MLDLVVWVMSLLEEMYKDGVHEWMKGKTQVLLQQMQRNFGHSVLCSLPHQVIYKHGTILL